MDPFYELYKDAGLIPIEIGINGVIALICYAGIALNLSLVYTTVKTKSLHRPCNILIALYAFFISSLLLGYTIKFFVFLFGINFISLRNCYIIQFVPLFCTTFGIILQLCIGIDRLIGVLCPVWYKLRMKYKLFIFLISMNLLATMIDTSIQYYGASLHWEKPVMYTYGEPIHQEETSNFMNLSTQFIYSAEILCYALIWAIIFGKKTSISSNNKRLMISLSIIMAIGVVNILLTMFFTLILPPLNLDIFTIEYVIMPTMTIIFMVSNSSVTPILFLCSKEYSSAFRACFRRTSVVTTVAPIQLIH